METNWILQEPIDLEHKQYVLLDYLQKLDKNLNSFKLYPQFQEISLHLANINLLVEKGQILSLNRVLKDPDDEILLSDLAPGIIPQLNDEELLEVYKICQYTSPKLTDYFNHAKAIWEIVNDTVSINPIQNRKKIEPKQGLFYLEYNDKTLLYEFLLKPIKRGVTETKCHIKKISECEKKDFENVIKQVKRPLIKNLQEEIIYKNLILFKVSHNNAFPLKETLLPIVKRKIMNYMIQSKIIENKSLTNGL
jgi:hypothetical protein